MKMSTDERRNLVIATIATVIGTVAGGLILNAIYNWSPFLASPILALISVIGNSLTFVFDHLLANVQIPWAVFLLLVFLSTLTIWTCLKPWIVRNASDPGTKSLVVQTKKNVSAGQQFIESFHHDLNDWNYSGAWSIESENGQQILCVTNSEEGGIAKRCVGWTDYLFEFETKIVNSNTSWIIRAKNLDTYVMLQCDPHAIYPHFRLPNDWDRKRIERARENPIRLPVILPENTWFGVQIFVRDANVAVTLVVDSKNYEVPNIPNPLLKPPIASIKYLTGSIGFRECAREHACFRNIRVTPEKEEHAKALTQAKQQLMRDLRSPSRWKL